MSEGNERNLESVAPEAAENIESVAEKAEAPASEPAVAEEKTEAAEPIVEEEKPETPEPEAPAQAEPAPAQAEADGDDDDEAPAPKSKKNKKKRGRRSAVIPLAIALVVVLLIFGVLVGYGLGRVRSQRQEAAQNGEGEPPVDAAVESADGYDPFSEALTNENQQALDVLAGLDAPEDGDAGALLGEDALFEADDGAQQPAAEPVVVAEYGDGQTLMSDEVLEAYNEELTSYILSGYSEEEVAGTLLDDVLQRMVGDRVLEQHAKEMGLYEIGDEDRAQIEEQAKAEYAEQAQYYRALVTGAGDMTEEEIESAAEAALLEAEGVDYESVAARVERDWWKHKLYDALTESVTVDDAAVQAAYEDRLAEQKESFTAYPDDFEFSQRSGETILYNLPGYRAVKVLQLGFDDAEAAMAVYALSDEISMLDADAGAADEPANQAELDGYYAGPEARAKEALEQLRGGADMDELILSMGQDAGMRDEKQRAMGYYVSADSTLWPEEFVTAAMALANVGDYSEPVRTEDGVCILQYVGDVPEGEVPLDDVREALTADVLKAARDAAYEEQRQAWVAEANPTYYPERLQDG